MTNAGIQYDRKELLTFDEAATKIGVSRWSITRAVQTGILTSVRIPHEMNKFIPRYEVEPLVNTGKITSREARARIEEARKKVGVVASHEGSFNLDGTPDWISKSELVAMLMEMGFHFERLLSDKLQEQREQFLKEVRELAFELVKQNPEVASRVQKFAEVVEQSKDKPAGGLLDDALEFLS